MGPNNGPQMSFGSGSATLGGGVGDALQQAIANQRLGLGGATQQMSPSGDPMQGQMQQPQMGGSPSQPQMQQATPSMGTPGMPQMTPSGGLTPEAENQIILQALAGKLKSNSKVHEAKHIPQPLT